MKIDIQKIKKQLGFPSDRPLTLQEKRRYMKFAVYPLFFLIFAGIVLLIYSPTEKEKAEAEKERGFNTEIPSPEESRMEGNKVSAYEREALSKKERGRKDTFLEMSELFNRNKDRKDTVPSVDSGVNLELPSVPETVQTHNPVRSSPSAYHDMNRSLTTIYTPRETSREEELLRRIEELEKRQNMEPSQEQSLEEKMALMEKSYELAAKYMNGQNGQSVPPQPGQIVQVAPSAPIQGKGNAIPVKSVSDRTVSGLQQLMSNAEFIAEYGKPRNYGFNTAVGSGYSIGKNTIRACVHNDQTLMDGQTVKLRLLEPLQAGNVIVPKNSLVSGSAKVQGERLDILVSSLEYAGNIIPVELAVYDSDGQKGLSVPSSLEQEAAKEAMANIGAGLGTSISFAQSAGQQVAMDITRGLMQGGSQYLAKKFRTVKVHLKANYQVMLYAKQQ